MKLALVLLSVFAFSSLVIAEQDTPEMAEARIVGVTVLQLMQEKLASYDKPEFPGIHAWLVKEGKTLGALDKGKPDASWRELSGDTLILHCANYWQLFYEIVPGDPGLAMLHAGTLMAAGDANRAQAVLRLTLHRGDLDEGTVKILTGIIQHCGRFKKSSDDLVHKGIRLHDKGDYTGALAQYDAALRLWPFNGWAAYERGFTTR